MSSQLLPLAARQQEPSDRGRSISALAGEWHAGVIVCAAVARGMQSADTPHRSRRMVASDACGVHSGVAPKQRRLGGYSR